MSFHYAQFPFYNPAQLPDWNPATILASMSDSMLSYSVHAELHQLRATIDFSNITPKLIEEARAAGCAQVNIPVEDKELLLSFPPLGLTHLVIPSDIFSNELIEEIDERIAPHTISISTPSEQQVEALESEWILRSDLVRWFYPLDFSIEDWPGKDRYRYKRQLRKSDELEVITTILNEETAATFLAIWEREVVHRPGGIRMFYERVFQDTSTYEKEIPVVEFRMKGNDTVLGSAVINPYGSFGDFKTSTPSYHALWMQAYDSSLLPFAPAYKTADIIAQLGRERGDAVSSQGGDLTVWGAEIRTGLLQQKSALMMQPYPENTVELFSLRRPADILTASGQEHLVLLELQRDHPVVVAALNTTHHIAFTPEQALATNATDVTYFSYWTPSGETPSQKLPLSFQW